jgi:arginase family enzyme
MNTSVWRSTSSSAEQGTRSFEMQEVGRRGLDAVRRIAIQLPVIGMDVVEGAPAYDSAEITSFLANRVVLEMLSGIAYRRRGGTWEGIPPTLLKNR